MFSRIQRARGWMCVCAAGLAWPAQAADVKQLFKLLAEDGGAGDLLGVAVAVDDGVAVLSAIADADNGERAGAAYLFDVTTGEQLFKLLAEDGDEHDNLGLSVAISGSTVVVGAANDEPNGVNSGSVYVFDATTGQQIRKLVPADGDGEDFFGWSVAIDGSTVVVGAVGDEDGGLYAGSVYLFDAATGEQIAKLVPDDVGEEDQFGYSVAISGSLLIVGAASQDRGGSVGSAYLFDATTGEQLHKLFPAGGEGGNFGGSVAISGTTAIIGAPAVDDNGAWSGAAYLFDTVTGEQIAKLLPQDGEPRTYFGTVVGISPRGAVSGRLNLDTNNGAAYLFDAQTGEQLAKVLPDNGSSQDGFGRNVAIDGSTIVVGAPGDDEVGQDAGAGYVFGFDCAADFNGDGVTDTRDFVAYLNAWADERDEDCSGGGCAADFNGDGVVDTRDFIEFLGVWAAGC